MAAYEFYLGRLSACPLYGFKSGHEILHIIIRCAIRDKRLTEHQFNTIINRAWECHIKMLEDNYNEEWNR